MPSVTMSSTLLGSATSEDPKIRADQGRVQNPSQTPHLPNLSLCWPSSVGEEAESSAGLIFGPSQWLNLPVLPARALRTSAFRKEKERRHRCHIPRGCHPPLEGHPSQQLSVWEHFDSLKGSHQLGGKAGKQALPFSWQSPGTSVAPPSLGSHLTEEPV